MTHERGPPPALTRTPPILGDVLLLAALWAVAVIAIDPRGDFPLNDDWAYAIAVRRLLAEGAFRPPTWAGMTLLSQALWGALIASIAGFSHTALRASTLLLGGAAIVGTYLLARQLRAARELALLAALVLAANPLFVVLSHTFMTDVPMLAMLLYALLFFARALETGSRTAWGAATALTIAAVLCRQPGIVPALGFVATVVLRPPDRRRWLGRAPLSVLLAGGALLSFQIAMQSAGALPPAYWTHTDVVQRLSHAGAGSALRLVLGNVGVAMLYCGLFLLPLLVVCAPRWRAARQSSWRWDRAIEGATLAVAAAGLWVSGRRMPLRGNMLIESGLGPVTLNDWYIRHLANDPRLPVLFWWGVTAAGVIGAALLATQVAAAAARVLRDRRTDAAPTAARTLLLATSGLYLGPICVIAQFDRYLLPLIPMLGVALLPPSVGPAVPRRAWIGAGLGLALLAAYAVAGTHDYLAWNRARWQALRQLADAGVDARRIDGGLEFNAPLFHAEGRGNSGAAGRSWWWVIDDEYLVTMGPVPGYEVEQRVAYRRWLPPGTATIAVLHRAPP